MTLQSCRRGPTRRLYSPSESRDGEVRVTVAAKSSRSSPGKSSSFLQTLEAIERSIALTDRQRLLVLQTTDLAVATVLREHWSEIRESHAVTLMIARRMFNYYSSQKELKNEISLSTIQSASGVFQQVVGTYLRAYLRAIDPSFTVELDKPYGKVHPDIAVEKLGRPWSAIEVKTDLGWRRSYISSGEWKKRQQGLYDSGFRQAYLLILANTNWSGWDPSMKDLDVRVILRISPNVSPRFRWYREETAPLDVGSSPTADVLHGVEPIFEEIARWRGRVAS